MSAWMELVRQGYIRHYPNITPIYPIILILYKDYRVYWGNIGIMDKDYRVCWSNIGRTEKNMETTIYRV